ncbi:hypothetical protein [Candidatus Borrarchaeum sp.]|uniref:hypothetical protein n=1 Tax=Candidatus Borrarchaeum sp. TaxID=2846742 RepID=UPI00257E0A93|nr:hypothetical protein [Candidatus Borrarchaeum sp.]
MTEADNNEFSGDGWLIGKTGKGDPIYIELPKEEEKTVSIETGHIDKESSFQLCYFQVKKYIQKTNKQTGDKELAEIDRSLHPFIIYKINEERGYEPLKDNNIFSVNGTAYKVKKDFDFPEGMGMSREAVVNFLQKNSSLTKLDEFYTDLKNFLSQYTWYEDHRLYDLETLYVIGTYFHQAFNVYPIYALRGPPECGKTRTNQVMCSVSYNALFTPNLSDATFYYARSNYHCSLGLDETNIRSKKEESILEDLINNAYKKGGAVLRMSEGNPRKIIPFSVFGPLIYSSTKEMPYATSTRAIEVMMQVTDKSEYSDKSEPYREDSLPTIIRDKLYIVTLESGSEICEHYHNLSNKDYNISNRDWELFKPFLALTSFFAPYIEDSLIEVIKERIKQKTIDKTEQFDYQVLLVLKQIIDIDAETQNETNWRIKDGYLYLKDFTGIVIDTLGLDPKYYSWRPIQKSLKNLNLYRDPTRGTGNRAKFRVDYEKVENWIKRSGLSPFPIDAISQENDGHS